MNMEFCKKKAPCRALYSNKHIYDLHSALLIATSKSKGKIEFNRGPPEIANGQNKKQAPPFNGGACRFLVQLL